MKTSKLLLAAAALAVLALADSASAQTKIYISGAPATRTIWNIAISNTIASLSTGSPTITTAYTGTSFNSANQVTWTGGNISGSPVTIKASWTGSTAGIQSVAQNPSESNTNFQVKFLPDGVSGSGQPDPTSGSNAHESAYPHFTLSDTFQATVPFHGHSTVTSPATDYFTLQEASASPPAITGFKFVANNGSPSSLQNLTPNLAQNLFTAGSLPLAFFSGLSADQGTTVYSVGRDIGSGARYVLLAETGIGTANSASLVQYTVNTSSGVIGSYTPSAGGTINEITFDAGNGGYPSFSAVLTALSATATPSVGYFVTYVTDSDAATAEAAGAHELSWNGFFESAAKEGASGTAPISIAEGQYTYWSYLHVHYLKTFIQANHPLSYTFANSLNSDLATDTSTGAILNSDVSVIRHSDGGLITQLY